MAIKNIRTSRKIMAEEADTEMIAEERGIDLKYLKHVDEKSVASSNIYPPYGSGTKAISEITEYTFAAQKEIIERVAQEGPCFIVGRCADIILGDRTELFRVFITGSQDSRSDRVVKRENLSADIIAHSAADSVSVKI